MKHFTIGPVEMYPSTKEIREHDFVYFRGKEFSGLVLNTLNGLSGLLGNDVPNSLIYMAASGTAAMEAAVENCVADSDKVLVIDGGGFGHRFCQLLAYHRKQYEAVKLRWDEALTPDHLKPFDNKGFTMLFVNLHETQTGQLYPLELLAEFCRRNGMMLVVDAISAFLADEYDMGKYGIDLTIISSQKGLALSPGMAFVSFSQRMLDKIASMPDPASKYFDFKDYLKNIVRGQTPYTPPVFVMYELADMLRLIDEEGGREARLHQVGEKSAYFRQKARDMGMTVPNYPLSNALTPLYFEDIDAGEVIKILAEQFRTFVNPCGGELGKHLFRVSHIGNTDLHDIDVLLKQMQRAIAMVREKQQ